MNAEQAAALRALVDAKGTSFTGTGYREDLVNVIDHTGKVVLPDPIAEYLQHVRQR